MLEANFLLNVDIYQSLAPVLLWIVTAYSSIYFNKSSTFEHFRPRRAQIMLAILDSKTPVFVASTFYDAGSD